MKRINYLIERYFWIIPLFTTFYYWINILVVYIEIGSEPWLKINDVKQIGMGNNQKLMVGLLFVLFLSVALYIINLLIRLIKRDFEYFKDYYKYMIRNTLAYVFYLYTVVLFDNSLLGWFLD
jgi:hypothetical protein